MAKIIHSTMQFVLSKAVVNNLTNDEEMVISDGMIPNSDAIKQLMDAISVLIDDDSIIVECTGYDKNGESNNE